MNYWRMAMRVGNQGTSLWPQCHLLSIAAITYDPVVDIDFQNYSESSLPKEWKELKTTQPKSLKRFIWHMNIGDIIYVKDGNRIVSKGEVISNYFFDHNKSIIDENGLVWPHQRKIKWDDEFPEIEIFVGSSQQHTVYPLLEKDVSMIEKKLKIITENEKKSVDDEIFTEGERFTTEQEFRSRNSLLIKKKKKLSNYKCEICGFDFYEVYGDIGYEFIEAHHLIMVSSGKRKSTLNDISLICSNCHSMVHRRKPPYSIEEIKQILKLKK